MVGKVYRHRHAVKGITYLPHKGVRDDNVIKGSGDSAWITVRRECGVWLGQGYKRLPASLRGLESNLRLGGSR